MRWFFVTIVFLIVAGVAFSAFRFTNSRQAAVEQRQPNQIDSQDIFDGTSYRPIDPSAFEVQTFAIGLSAPTRLKFTPDGKYLLFSQITGELFSFSRTPTGWNRTPRHVATIETKFPGFPPDEAGLVGLVFSNHFDEDGKLYLLYTYKDESGNTQNQISVTTLYEKDGTLVGDPARLIYKANVSGSGSHQITDGIALDIEGTSHLLIAIGEGFDGKKAQNPSLEAGKLVLIKSDGSDPLGLRPFAENPKVQALGIRNAFVMLENPFDPLKRIMIADTGPDRFDRLLYTVRPSPEGTSQRPVNFGWNGDEETLADPLPDPNITSTKDMAIIRLPETRTFTGLSIHPGKGSIPQPTARSQTILATLFGKTGYKDNKPGKEVWMGQLTNLFGQPTINFKPIIERDPKANGKIGNPIGLAVDGETGDFFFADILEGRIYRVIVK